MPNEQRLARSRPPATTMARLFALLCPCLTGCVTEDGFIDDLVVDYCTTRWDSCGCEGPGVTEIECESSNQRLGADAQAAAQEAGLVFDQDCAKQWLERFEPRCGLPLGQQSSECYPGVCAIYHGSRPADEPCTLVGESGWSDCAQGLRCDPLRLVCQDPCGGLRRGDACGGDVFTDCVGDLVCTVDQTCGDAPAIGEPCMGQCERGAVCDWEQVLCVPGGAPGDSCSGSEPCGQGYRCVDAVCEVEPALVCRIDLPW